MDVLFQHPRCHHKRCYCQLEEIAQSFSTTVPQNGSAYTADERTAQLMKPYCEQNGSRLLLCGTNGTAQENQQIALWVAEELGAPAELVQNIMGRNRDQGTPPPVREKRGIGGLWTAVLALCPIPAVSIPTPE